MINLPRAEFAFPGPLRDKLVASILSGEKTATSSLREQYVRAGDTVPQVGDRSVLIDSEDREVATLRVTAVALVPVGEVTLDHAIAEGEGFETVQQWLDGHMNFWTSEDFIEEYGAPPIEVTADTIVVCEWFTVEDLLR